MITTSAGRRGAALACGVALVALAAAGCSKGSVVDKSGGQIVVLRLATIDDLNPNDQTIAPGEFIKALIDISGGHMKATVQTTFGDGAPTAESDLVKAIADGTLDGGWPSTRAFANAGIRGLGAVEAPMQITSYAAESAVATGPAARTILRSLDSTKVVGLGLAMGPLRRPFATKAPLLDPQAWRGVTFRVFNSPTQQAAVTALGGVPVNASFHFPDLIQSGQLHGAESDIATYAKNSYGTLAPEVARNVVLWPKMLVLAVGRARFNALTAQQQGWLRQAADRAVQASVRYKYDESAPASRLCGVGVRFVDASPQQLAELRQKVAPVLDSLSSDPTTGPSMAQIKQVAAAHPVPDAPAVPSSCRSAGAPK